MYFNEPLLLQKDDMNARLIQINWDMLGDISLIRTALGLHVALLRYAIWVDLVRRDAHVS